METMSAKDYAASHASEDELQVSICQWLDLFVSRGWLVYWSTPNELPRPSLLTKLIGKAQVDKIYAMIGFVLNRRGRKSGAPDLVIQIAHGPVIYVECKSGDGRLSAAQKGFRDWFAAHGCIWVEARRLDDVIGIVQPRMDAIALRLAA